MANGAVSGSNELLRLAETAQCHPRGDPLYRRRLGDRAGHLSTGPVGRRTGMGDALVSGRCSDCFSVLHRVRLVLRIYARGLEARKRDRPGRVDQAPDRA